MIFPRIKNSPFIRDSSRTLDLHLCSEVLIVTQDGREILLDHSQIPLLRDTLTGVIEDHQGHFKESTKLDKT